VRRRGRHLLVSPMDWGLIAAWRDAGVPLAVALRGIDVAMDSFFARQRRGSAKVNSLCYCHDSVMAEFDAYRESRVGESPSQPRAPAPPEAGGAEEVSESAAYVSGILRRLESLPERARLDASAAEGIARVRQRLESVLEALGEGGRVDFESLERDLGMADAVLVEALTAGIGGQQRLEWEQEAKTELKIYRRKLPKEMYAKIHENCMRGKIHRAFDIPEFSLFRL